VVAKSINSRGAVCRNAMLLKDRKELVASEKIISKDGVFKLLSMTILARQVKRNC